ncbi:MAG TPA: hypothetical protein VII72_22835 [Myxococcota bacterium]|jgi:hypothetical protein
MRSWTIALAGSLLLGLASASLADDTAAPAEPAAEESAAEPAPAAAGDESATAPEETPPEEAEAAPEEAAAEEPEAGFFRRYGHHVSNTFLAGVNGLITWPADPVMLAVRPTDEMREMPGGVVTGPVTGFFAGTLLGVYRLATGTLDVALCPLSFFPMFSPEPRYQVIPGWEHEG